MNLPENVLYVTNTLEKAGYSAYLVGGCVRDMLMKKPPHDYDLTTNALPEQIIACFSGYQIIPTGLKHGTVAIYVGGEVVEVTTYRIDGQYSDNRHPDSVSFTDHIEDDLARRDFTMNAIAMTNRGELCDPYGGADDIRAGIIRCVGDPDRRFSEDGLRILRGLRFASVLGFDIENKTSDSIHKLAHLLSNISAERIQTETYKLICGQNAQFILSEYRDVFEVFMPCSERVSAVDTLPCDIPLRLSLMLCDADDADAVLCRQKTSNAVRDEVLCILSSYREMPADKPGIRRYYGEHGADMLKKSAIFAECMGRIRDKSVYFAAAEDIEAHALPCRITDLAVTGNDVIALGVHGREVGRVLSYLFDLVLRDELKNEKAALIGAARTYIS